MALVYVLALPASRTKRSSPSRSSSEAGGAADPGRRLAFGFLACAVLATGLSVGHYVELVGVVVSTVTSTASAAASASRRGRCPSRRTVPPRATAPPRRPTAAPGCR